MDMRLDMGTFFKYGYKNEYYNILFRPYPYVIMEDEKWISTIETGVEKAPPILLNGQSRCLGDLFDPVPQTTSSSFPRQRQSNKTSWRNSGVHQPQLPQAGLFSNPRNPVCSRSSKRRRKIMWLLGPLWRGPQPGGPARWPHSRALRDSCSGGGAHAEFVSLWLWPQH